MRDERVKNSDLRWQQLEEEERRRREHEHGLFILFEDGEPERPEDEPVSRQKREKP